ncbi:MAG TPA: hypothetical protein VM284_00385 [Candidatus Limnocylindria bacterium]|nr:hypothetical protein [Candidatus Limnocylindria bacterium]
MPIPNALRRPLLILLVALASALLITGSALAHHKPGHTGGPPSGNDPHDNRGTVKIHEGATEPAALMASEPQVCSFHIHMFKFHANQVLGISIVGQGGANVAGPDTYTSTVTTDANGDARDPDTRSITLADGTYKLTVDTGKGAGKHKVFKVDCADSPPTGPTGGGGDVGGPTPGNGPGTGPGAVPGGSGVEGPTNPPKPGLLPNTATEPTDSRLPLGAVLVLLAALGGFVFVARNAYAFKR